MNMDYIYEDWTPAFAGVTEDGSWSDVVGNSTPLL